MLFRSIQYTVMCFLFQHICGVTSTWALSSCDQKLTNIIKYALPVGRHYAYEFGYNEHPAITSRFFSIKIIDSNVKTFSYKAVADLHSKILDAPSVQILLISCSFWEDLAKSYACVSSPKRVGAPTSGKSWIRHCKKHPLVTTIFFCNFLFVVSGTGVM